MKFVAMVAGWWTFGRTAPRESRTTIRTPRKSSTHFSRMTRFCPADKSNSDFDTQSREQWRGQLRKLSLIRPSPMTVRRGHTQEGKRSPHALSIPGSRRFLVIEFDLGSVDDHVVLFLYLGETQGPLALVVHSGNKSLQLVCLPRANRRTLAAVHRARCLIRRRPGDIDPESILSAFPDGTRKVEPQIPDPSANDDGRAALGKVISKIFRNLESPIP